MIISSGKEKCSVRRRHVIYSAKKQLEKVFDVLAMIHHLKNGGCNSVTSICHRFLKFTC